MELTFNNWCPFEFFDSLANLKPGEEIYIYDPACEPPVFRAFFRGLIRDRHRQEIEGVTYEIASEEKVELIANRYRKFVLASLPTYAPRNRVGRSRVLDLDHMHTLGGYNA